MDKHDTNVHRRKFLTVAATGVGGIGLAATAIPFIKSMSPSEAAKAAGAPVEVDMSRVEPGMLVTVEWRGKPVWVLHRTEQMLDVLGKHDDQLVDPQSIEPQQPAYAKNATRSIKPQYLVAVGICTHLGCIPLYRPEVAPADLGQDWPGGFYCPCHGSKFDLAGRVARNVPAPHNLEIPPHEYVSDTRLLIGKDSQSS
ncbi:ubiquinol-cytochrome c reductase iron-sulfur subunit [Noviherbaspirillum sedimenti]|uniref:Ubiquinol-cytochrome c reductase iron-sulfur subunit n=1 Tax=Noviherbaspirillum sedimenti TaxID=2320865 RepID=A0A3A3G4T3_9BURK|nr:ubiquinol-cytochrome c reductase iron-sulfur subunit [Noviherbaspirillum sedimenti]RJG03497.1 ubiquinol-cytochrome c reductase iron-sulfur subunit [Noviherbaspirillum sedimenti]